MPKKQSTSQSAAAAAPAAAQCLLLTQKAEVKEVTLRMGADGLATLPLLQALLKKKEAPELIGTYTYKAQTLYLFGYQKGKAGTENKHELPPPHDSILCFGDILLLASQSPTSWAQPSPFKASDYETFYTRAFGGFEDLDEDEEEEAAEAVVEEEAEAEVEVEEEEEEVEDDEAEDAEEEDEEADAEADDAAGEDDMVAAPVPKKAARKAKAVATGAAPAKAKKARRGGTGSGAAANATSSAYTSYCHIPESEELREDWSTPDAATLPPPRAAVRNSLKTLLQEHLKPEELDAFEQCIYNAAVRNAGQRHVGKAWSHPPFVELYRMTAKTLAANFHPDSYVKNTELFQRYKDGQVTFADICSMDPYHLFEAHWRDNFIAQQAQEKRQLEGNRAMATDRFVCTRCWKRECTYYELQTRSADEPMTIFITCINCGKHWRQ